VNTTTALEQATSALRLADVAAGRAAPSSAAAVRRARVERDAPAESVAERAWGRALLQTGDVHSAIGHLQRSIDIAEETGAAELAGESRIPLAAALIQRGRPEQALREIDAAVAGLTGAGRARALAQRADVLHQTGRLAEAAAEYQVAMPLLRRADDPLNLQRALVNRGILHTERHTFAAAEADLLEAGRLARRLGRQLAAGIIAENLGFLETLRGNVPAALEQLDRAERAIGEHGGQLGPVFLDRCELLLAVGVPAEAQQAAERGVLAFERQRRGLMIPIAQVQLAQAALLAGDRPTALDQARRARHQFRRQERGEWAEFARLIVLRTELAHGGAVRVPMSGLLDMVSTLDRAGWPAAALEARLVAAELMSRRGRVEAGRELLRQAASTRRRGPTALRARGWYAEALLRTDGSDRRGAASAIRAGLRLLDEHGASLGASDLRAYSAVHRRELTELGLRAALRDGGPHEVFAWAERGRASRLLHRPVRPPADPVLADLLAQLRATARDADRVSTPQLVQRQVELERQVRDRSRRFHGDTAPAVAPVPVPRLGRALAGHGLVEFVALDGELHALSLFDGRLRRHDLGPLNPITNLIDRFPFALHQLTRRESSPAARSAALALLTDAARRLDRLLFGPIADLDEQPLVIVPTGPLHDVPWSVLPGCAGRPVTVSPSATLWHSASTRPSTVDRKAAAVAGPGLTGARSEALAVAEIHEANAFLDDQATVEAVLEVLRSTDLVHLAAHGRLALDNPLFSSLRLHDGPLVVHDLERQDRVPHTVVLASCDSGRSLVCTGDELLGLSATFIARGTRQLVASVVPIPDAETTPLMTALHRGLRAGRSAAAALATAQQDSREQGPREMAAAAGFICVGGAGPQG
jgi:tetratricopeptide (TPR) repeat protein